MILFRLIQNDPYDAATNMAIDEALFLSHREKISRPTLRLYRWNPPSLSIGCSQNPQEILDLGACKKKNIGFVRRPTGGGVIFHNDELTYSLALSQSDLGLPPGIKESFEKLTSFLITAYQSLGASACFAKDISGERSPYHLIEDFCLSRKEDYDILVNGKKIGGNAQKRKKNIILQHGSIPFSFDKDKIRPVFQDPTILDSLDITTLNEITNSLIDFDQFVDILINAFCRHFDVTLEKGELTDEEKNLAEELKAEKYNNPEWNYYKNCHNVTMSTVTNT